MKMKILSVDDSRTIRMVVTRAFRTYDCTMCEACNGEEGLAAAAKERPDLILLDVTMPVMDGVTMLTKLKEDPQLKTIQSSCSQRSPAMTTSSTSPGWACVTIWSSRSRTIN